MMRFSLVIFAALVVCNPDSTRAISLETYQTSQVTVRYESTLRPAAEEVAGLAPDMIEEIESFFGWRLPYRPAVVLIRSPETFLDFAGSAMIAAYAVPEEGLIVFDYSRRNASFFKLTEILKHELIHLLLHANIMENRLPRWLDEGVAQWASGSVGELAVMPGRSMLERALLRRDTIPLEELARGFPSQRQALLLAYEESKSIVVFIEKEYGKRSILRLLEYLKNKETLESAVYMSLSMELQELESRWLQHEEKRTSWLTFLAVNVYEILFLLGALLTFAGFVRYLMRKRAYRDGEEE